MVVSCLSGVRVSRRGWFERCPQAYTPRTLNYSMEGGRCRYLSKITSSSHLQSDPWRRSDLRSRPLFDPLARDDPCTDARLQKSEASGSHRPLSSPRVAGRCTSYSKFSSVQLARIAPSAGLPDHLMMKPSHRQSKSEGDPRGQRTKHYRRHHNHRLEPVRRSTGLMPLHLATTTRRALCRTHQASPSLVSGPPRAVNREQHMRT